MGLFKGSIYKSNASLEGKTVVITGANTGIGYETAKGLLQKGARVIFACRNLQSTDIAVRKLREQILGSDIRLIHLDLASLRSVRKCADELIHTQEKIHVLINNAGVMACPYALTEDGYEMQFQVNHLGHFLLTMLLLPRLKECAPSRIINVSSTAHHRAILNFDDLVKYKNMYDPAVAYKRSKLCNVLFTVELQERLKGTGVVSYAVHPGVVATDIGRHMAGGCIFKNLSWLIKSPQQGAQTSIYCATEDKLDKQSGTYYSKCKPVPCSKRGRSKEDSERLWKMSEELVSQHLVTFL